MSLEATYETDNIFAKIIRGEAPCVKLWESDRVLSFMDVFPQSRGHCLVIHKTAVATNLFDLSEDDLQEVTSAVQRIAGAVRRALNPDGVRVFQFNGAAAGQTVFHYHVHIAPAYENESMGRHASGGPADAGELEELAALIRKEL